MPVMPKTFILSKKTLRISFSGWHNTINFFMNRPSGRAIASISKTGNRISHCIHQAILIVKFSVKMAYYDHSIILT